ncbi:peptide deformylase [Ruminococcus sp.]|jgi:peptide deformylase|uniref:peptide deformylase n=1 Tax=Ruminococcus sp. TaxID=41978 RepID=UPI00265CBFB7|nr:peptide deformylase [uncultured Ruminococcus sp.]
MIREIVKDTFFLSQKSEPATRQDLPVIQDLLDTIRANADRCVGMAANMIGERKTILAAQIGKDYLVMINPKIVDHSKQCYETEESCLSLTGQRPVKRYSIIVVEYLDRKFKRKKQTFRDFEAQIIQHEMDHFEGILI